MMGGGADRVPERYRVSQPAPEVLYQAGRAAGATAPPTPVFTKTGVLARHVAISPARSTARDAKSRKSGRLRKELR